MTHPIVDSEPRVYDMALSTVGLSVGGDVTADVIVVKSFDELEQAGKEGRVEVC